MTRFVLLLREISEAYPAIDKSRKINWMEASQLHQVCVLVKEAAQFGQPL